MTKLHHIRTEDVNRPADGRSRRGQTDRRKLGELLVETGLVQETGLIHALEVQKESGKRLGQVLVELGQVTEEEIAFALAMQLKIPFIDLKDYHIEPHVIEMVPEEVCRRYLCIPLETHGNLLHISMADPLDLNVIKEIQFVSGARITPSVSTATQILDRLRKYYNPDKVLSEVTEQLESDELLEFYPEEKEIEEDEFGKFKDSPFMKMVDLIIKNAIKRGASDVHVEAEERHVRVRNRIDGVLQETIRLPKWTQPIIISRIKVLGGMNITEKRLPQDGRIKVKGRNLHVDLRVSTLPTFYGEKAVIRILNKEATFLTLEDLGYSKENLTILRSAIHQPQGMVIITGATGSGKTSTLYACMREIRSDEINIITVEDPVEYELVGLNQVHINEKIGLTFPNVLRSILRQDPNVLMIGEIRDKETAEIALQASLTGHLVFSTLHTIDAPTAITRLLDIGMPAFLIASSLVCVVAQRLVRVICSRCKEEYVPEADMLSRISMSAPHLPFKFYRGAGCDGCAHTGYKGRTAVEEVMIMGYKMRELVHAGATADTLREAAMATGMTTLGVSGIKKIQAGITTIDEVVRAVHHKEELTTVCGNCGKAVSLDFKDCPICKHALVPTCDACTRIVQPDWVVCPYCRNDLK